MSSHSGLFRKSSVRDQSPTTQLDSIYSDEDDNAFTVIKTNYKLDRKKKVHDDVNRNSYFNITALEFDSKRNCDERT